MLSAPDKKERITARTSVEIREKLIEAAAFSGTSLNQFLVQAAIEKAQDIIERERLIKLSDEDTQVFFDALENPPEPNDKLKNAVERYKNSGLYEQTENRTTK